MRVVLSRGTEILREIALDKPIMLVGRDPLCDIVIDDITVSKRHMKIEVGEGVLQVDDLASRNGTRVNGHAAVRHALGHLDVIELGDHRLHVFDDALLPGGIVQPERTVHNDFEHARAATLPLAETQERPNSRPDWRSFGLMPLYGASQDVLRLDEANTMIGRAGRSALVVRRRDSLFLSRLSRDAVRVNGHDLGPGSRALGVNDVVEVGSDSYMVVAIEA